MRLAEQPELNSSNSHFRGSINDYSHITIDDRGKRY